jgi:L-iditol 2-dehydrogenase
MVAHGMGAEKVILCDVVEPRLEFCKSCVPIETVNTRGLTSQQVADKIKQLAGGLVDGCIDCCGVESAVQAAIYATKNGGVVTLVGMGKDQATIPLLDASCREVELQGVFRYRNTYPKCIELLAKKKVNVEPLITHRYVFNNDSIMDAFKCCMDGKSPDGRSSIKCMININDEDAEKAQVQTPACVQNKKLF